MTYLHHVGCEFSRINLVGTGQGKTVGESYTQEPGLLLGEGVFRMAMLGAVRHPRRQHDDACAAARCFSIDG